VLAPAVICWAIDWIVNNMTSLEGVEVGRDRFTDLDYADDIVLPVSDYDELVPCVTQFSLSAGTMGLNVPWSKTKIHCLGRSGLLSDFCGQDQDVDVPHAMPTLNSGHQVAGHGPQHHGDRSNRSASGLRHH